MACRPPPLLVLAVLERLDAGWLRARCVRSLHRCGAWSANRAEPSPSLSGSACCRGASVTPPGPSSRTSVRQALRGSWAPFSTWAFTRLRTSPSLPSYVRGRLRGISAPSLLDDAIAALGAAAVCAVFRLHGSEYAVSNDALTRATNDLAYPIGDLLLFGLVAGAATLLSGRGTVPWVVLAGACVLNCIGDTVNLFQSSEGHLRADVLHLPCPRVAVGWAFDGDRNVAAPSGRRPVRSTTALQFLAARPRRRVRAGRASRRHRGRFSPSRSRSPFRH